MKKFTITFLNGLGERKTEIMTLDFVTVRAAIDWFEETFGLIVKSMSKH